MEMIEITGYTIHEKVKIASNYLLPKQISENGLKPGFLQVPEEVLSKIVLDYTREAGVRQLERSISAICRWNAMKVITSDNPKSFTVKEETLEEVLGVPIFINDLSQRVAVPGVVIGMAWTAVGGKIMIVESSKCPGQGSLKITGKLGEVMKESVSTAVSWIKVNLRDILPKTESLTKCEGFDGVDLHIHFPAAAVPKDGPSAGITITTALVSLLTGIRARGDVAMTGEISLTGKVLPIGGVKEKVLGAHRMGIKTIILPKLNKKDIKEIPEMVKKELKFVLVDHVTEVIKCALETIPLSHLWTRV
jgi:ATP-dependent Lon protease